MIVFSVVEQNDKLTEMVIVEFEKIRKKHYHDWYNEEGRDVLRSKIGDKVKQRREISFVLPSFPCKSQNRDITLGKVPDFGEELALATLHNLCDRISRIYEPGARIVLASDGRLYADLIGVPDEDVLLYRNALLLMYEEMVSTTGSAQRLDWYSLDEAFPHVEGGDCKRTALVETYPQHMDQILELVKSDEHYNRLYVGFKNMMISELSVDKMRTKKSIEKEASRIARAMLERNFANAELLKRKFPWAIRLSIKHHDTRTGKYGVNLLPNHHDVGTPWLNVAVEKKDRSYNYMKKKIAEENGHVLCYKGSQPYYYRERL